MLRKWLTILLLAGAASAAPSTYDQRQDGDVNVKVDLDNFVILVARPISALDVLGSMSQLYADAKSSRYAANQAGLEHKDQQQQQQQEAISESKSAELDDKAKDAIVEELIGSLEEGSRLQEEEEERNKEKSEEKSEESRTVRLLKVKEPKDGAKVTKSINGKYKFVESVEEPQSLKLVGDAVENCGPGRSRDRTGVCQEDISQ